MRKLAAFFIVLLLFSPVIAHSDHGHVESDNESSDLEKQSEKQTGFSELYPEYRSGTIWVLAEVFIVFGVTAFAVRHYFQKSESSSLKEFIREDIL